MEKIFDNEIWIDLRGKVHRWEGEQDIISAHEEIARKLYPEIEFAGDYLFSLGWMKISKINGITISKEPTQRQIDTLFDERGGEIKYRVVNDFIPRYKEL